MRQAPRATGWALGALLALAPLACPAAESGEARESVRIGGERFQLELALDEASRTRGLMHRTHLDRNGGMLFVFPDSRPRRFWMGHCRIDLDAIFLDARGRVVALQRMKAEPPQAPDESDAAYRARMPGYPSDGPARYVIELKAGSLDRLDLRVGDRLELAHDRLLLLVR